MITGNNGDPWETEVFRVGEECMKIMGMNAKSRVKLI